MADSTKELKDWMVQHLKNRDVFFRKIKEIREKSDSLVEVEYKDKSQVIHILPVLDISKLKLEDCPVTLVTLNKKSNLSLLIKNWDILAAKPSLNVYFVNPSIVGENKWIIVPYTHNKIIEKKTLKLGLEALFSGIAEV